MTSQKQIVRLGLGEAIQRLLAVEFAYRTGVGKLPEKLLEERDLLLEAMNHVRIQIAFDCQGDGIPDTVEIFHQTADTSCCRLLPYNKTPDAIEKKPRRSSRTPSPKTTEESLIMVEELAVNVESSPEEPPKTKKKIFGLF